MIVNDHRLKILLLEDSPADAEIIKRSVLNAERDNYEFKLVMTEADYLLTLNQFKPDVILSDHALPQFTSIEALKLAREKYPNIPFILITGTVSEEFAVSIIKQGADDYILKDRLIRLSSSIEVALKQRKAEKEKLGAVKELRESNDRYKTVMKATSDTIWDWDLITDNITWNKNIQNIFGYVDTNLQTSHQWWFERIHPGDAESIQRNINMQTKDKTLRFEDEYRFLCADGTYKYIYDRSFLVLDSEGHPIRMIGAMQDITDRKVLDQKITKAIINTQDQERYQIGGELHDNVTQILAGTLISLDMIRRRPASSNVPSLLDKSHEYITMAIEEIKQLSHKLAPAIFNDEPLKESFERLLNTMNADHSYQVVLKLDSFENVILGNDIQLNLYRILQEQLNNITKYSGADLIEITVFILNNELKMIIHDNGKGFDTRVARKGIGLANIQKRVETFLGSFHLESSVGNGCKLTITIPLQDDK